MSSTAVKINCLDDLASAMEKIVPAGKAIVAGWSLAWLKDGIVMVAPLDDDGAPVDSADFVECSDFDRKYGEDICSLYEDAFKKPSFVSIPSAEDESPTLLKSLFSALKGKALATH